MFQIYMLKYCQMLSALRVVKLLSVITSDTSLTFLIKLLIIDSISEQLRDTRTLRSLLSKFVYNKDVIQPGDIIAYGSLVQQAVGEYHKFFDSKQWEHTDIKEKSQDEPLPMKAPTGEIKKTATKTANHIYLNIRHSEKKQ